MVLCQILWEADAKIDLKRKELDGGLAFGQAKEEEEQKQTDLVADLTRVKGEKEEGFNRKRLKL